MRFFLLTSVLLLGCAGAAWPETYTISINGFTADQTKTAVEAVKRWTDIVNDDTALHTTIRVNMGCVSHHRDEVCIQPEDPEPKPRAGHTRFGDDGSVIVHVNKEYTEDRLGLSHIIQHELGHAFGLDHTNDKTVMYPGFEPDGAQDVTPADVVRYLRLRGR